MPPKSNVPTTAGAGGGNEVVQEKRSLMISQASSVEGWNGSTVVGFVQGAKPQRGEHYDFLERDRGYRGTNEFSLKQQRLRPRGGDVEGEGENTAATTEVTIKASVLNHEPKDRTAEAFFRRPEDDHRTRHTGGFTWFTLELDKKHISPATGEKTDVLKVKKVKDVLKLRPSSILKAGDGLSEEAEQRLLASSTAKLLDLFSTEEDALYRTALDDEEVRVVTAATAAKEAENAGDDEEVAKNVRVPGADDDEAEGDDGALDDDDDEGGEAEREEENTAPQNVTPVPASQASVAAPANKRKTDRAQFAAQGDEADVSSSAAKKQKTETGNQQKTADGFVPPLPSPTAPVDLKTKCEAIWEKSKGKRQNRDKTVQAALKACAEFARWQGEPNVDLKKEWYRVSYAAALRFFKELGCTVDDKYITLSE